jgi:hypothetical protein
MLKFFVFIHILFLYVYSQDSLQAPTFSVSGGWQSASFDLSISHPDPDVAIYYTLDGSIPDRDNLNGTTYNYKQYSGSRPTLQNQYQTFLYTESLRIRNRTSDPNKLSLIFSTTQQFNHYFPTDEVFKGTVVRARAYKRGIAPSPIVTNSYFVTSQGPSRYNLPVASITIPEHLLFSYDHGIYVAGRFFDQWTEQNPGQTISGTTPANWNQVEGDQLGFFELFLEDGTRVLAQNTGFRMHGGWSRSFPRKTFRLYARKEYGSSTFEAPVFPSQPEYANYKRLLLRNSGNDEDVTIFRDGMIHTMLHDLQIDKQAFRPTVLFINGEYWGIHNLRERIDKHYIERKHGVHRDSIDFLERNSSIKEGNSEHYEAMKKFLTNNRLSQNENYEYIQTQMDVDNFIDYQIAQIYSRNTDWPHNNNQFLEISA